jgi:hypothetical protein
MTFEMLEVQGAKHQKSPLGHFLGELRKRVVVDPDFDDTLKQFLEDRNTFVHDLTRIPGYNLGTEEGLQAGIDFIIKLTAQAEHVRNVFSGFARNIGRILNGKDDTDFNIANLDDDKFYELTALMAIRFPTSSD